jgi:GT2 family glycosyltransferase
MIHVFILGYNRAQYFSEWFQKVNAQIPFQPNKKFYYIDNGQQEYTDDFLSDILIHKTESNIFCAGGWNLICDIAFKHLNLDKIIIGQEDAVFTDDILNQISQTTTPNQVCGTYDRGFEFSLYGIHKDTFSNIGRFDENFFLVGCEDNDYRHRCKMKGVDILGLNISANNNESSTSGPERSSTDNGSYLEQKWGKLNLTDSTIYEFKQPFDSSDPIPYIRPGYNNYFPKHSQFKDFMSHYEFNKYLSSI